MAIDEVSPYSWQEQRAIMRDLESSKRQAIADGDEERMRNLSGLRIESL